MFFALLLSRGCPALISALPLPSTFASCKNGRHAIEQFPSQKHFPEAAKRMLLLDVFRLDMQGPSRGVLSLLDTDFIPANRGPPGHLYRT